MTRDDLLTFYGITQPITEWALDYGITPGLIVRRLRHGLSPERAITKAMPAKPGDRLPEPLKPQPTVATAHAPEPVHRYQSPTVARALAHAAQKREEERQQVAAWIKRNDDQPVVKFTTGPKPKGHEAFGMTRTLKQWADLSGLPCRLLQSRISKGWPVDLAILAPKGMRLATAVERFTRARGEVPNFLRRRGTGGGSTTQAIPDLTFSQDATA